MPYVRRGAAFRRGMGQAASPCGYWTNFFCSAPGVSMVGGVPCTACAIPGPTLESGSVSPGLPSGYDASTGTVTANDTALTDVNPYAPTYPNVPGTSGAAASTCDWTQASWLDFTTWCGMNWAIAASVAVATIVLVRGKL